jgi:hypothetical protein
VLASQFYQASLYHELESVLREICAFRRNVWFGASMSSAEHSISDSQTTCTSQPSDCNSSRAAESFAMALEPIVA